MLVDYLERLFKLLGNAAVILAFSYLLSTTSFGRRLLATQITRITFRDKAGLAAFFGAFAFYSSLSVTSHGADLRIVGPLLAGFTGGPLCGLAAALPGLVGAILECHLNISSSLAHTCNLTLAIVTANCLAGLFAGLYLKRTGKIISLKRAISFTAAFDIAVAFPAYLLLAGNYQLMLETAPVIFPPMLVAHCLCIAVFLILIRNFANEQRANLLEEKINGEKMAAASIFDSLKQTPADALDDNSFIPRVFPESSTFFDNRFFCNLQHNHHYYFLYACFFSSQTPAALSISYVKPLFENLARNDLPPQEIHRAIKTQLHSFSGGSVRARLFCGKISIRSNAFEYYGSGGRHPLVMNPDGYIAASPPATLQPGGKIILTNIHNNTAPPDTAAAELASNSDFRHPELQDALIIQVTNKPAPFINYSMCFPPVADSLQILYDESSRFCQNHGFDKKICRDTSLLLDETVSNAVKYSGATTDAAAIKINIDFMPETGTLELTVSWKGYYFNPLAYNVVPDHNSRIPGGWGIFLIKKLTDDIHYERVSDYNTLIMKKTYSGEGC